MKIIPIAKPMMGDEEIEAVTEVLRSGMLTKGKKIKLLEKRFAEFCGTKYAVAVSSGGAALHCILKALDIGPGDEVIVPTFTFIASANCILMAGAKPVFVDVTQQDLNIDVDQIGEKITEKTKAIIAVDLYGLPADWDGLRAIAKKHKLYLIEDACQAVNAEYKKQKAGSLGDIAAFSLFATKNLSAGEGGLITTDNEKWVETIKEFRNHGQAGEYEYKNFGFNYRLTEMQAAIALEQLKKNDKFTMQRITNARRYDLHIGGSGLFKPVKHKDKKHVYHQYVIKVRKDTYGRSRDELQKILKKAGIISKVHYPTPIHLLKPYKQFGYKKGDFPVAEQACKEILSLPVYPGLRGKDTYRIIKVIKDNAN